MTVAFVELLTLIEYVYVPATGLELQTINFPATVAAKLRLAPLSGARSFLLVGLVVLSEQALASVANAARASGSDGMRIKLLRGGLATGRLVWRDVPLPSKASAGSAARVNTW